MESQNQDQQESNLRMRKPALTFGWLKAIGLGINAIVSAFMLFIFMINYSDPLQRDSPNYFIKVVAGKAASIAASLIGFSLGVFLIASVTEKNPTILKFWMAAESIFIFIEGMGIFFCLALNEPQGATSSALTFIFSIICLSIVYKFRKELKAIEIKITHLKGMELS